MVDPNYDVIQGGQAGTKTEPKMRRIVCVPTEAGSIMVVDRRTFKHVWLTEPVEIQVPEASVRDAVME